MGKRKFLNVGGNNTSLPLYINYDGWEHMMLDIDPSTNADIVCDARELKALPPGSFDSIYCSYNLEHYYRPEVSKAIDGLKHIFKGDGFVFVQVPDMVALMRIVVESNLDVDAILYKTRNGMSILVRNVIYGYANQIASSGDDFFSHKTVFSMKSLVSVLKSSGFSDVYAAPNGRLEVAVFAFVNKPSDSMRDFPQANLFRCQSLT